MSVTSLARLGALSALLALPLLGQVTIVPVPVQTCSFQPNPYKIASSTIYSVTVDDGAGTTVPVGTHVHIVDYPDSTTDHPNVYYAQFSFGGGSVNVHVTLGQYASNCNPSLCYQVSVSPLSYGINPALTTSGNVVSFTLKKSRYVMVSVKDLTGSHPYPYYLLIFADPLQTDAPDKSAAGVFNVRSTTYNADNTFASGANQAIATAVSDASAYASTHGGTAGIVYIPQGVYRIDGPIAAKSNVWVYLEPGAYLKVNSSLDPNVVGSHLYIFDAPDGSPVSNFKIYGRGTLDANGIAAANYVASKSLAQVQAGPIRIRNSDTITLDGIVLREADTWSFAFDNDSNVNVVNTKVVNYVQDFAAWRENDGFDLAQCTNSVVSHGFVFTADDAACFKGDNGYDQNTPADQPTALHPNNIMYDLVLWTEADGCRFGGEMRDQVDQSYFKNIDIVQAQRAVAVHATEGSAKFQDIGYADIRCEALVLPTGGGTLRPVDYSLQNAGSPSVVNLSANNVSVADSDPSLLVADSNSSFSNVTFEKLTINGVAVSNATAPTYFPNCDLSSANFSTTTTEVNVLTQAASGSTNWNTGSYSVANLTDGDTTASTGQARGVQANTNGSNGDAKVTYPVKNMIVTEARAWVPSGTYSFTSWQIEAHDPGTGTWTTLQSFANGGVTASGTWTPWVSLPPTMADQVKVTFRPVSGGVVGVNELQVNGH